MIYTHNLNPTLLDLGFLEIRWYGLFYAIAFLFTYFFLGKLAKGKRINFSEKQIEDLVFGIILGVILGGRIGYFLLYDFSETFTFEIFKIWNGGMSFHGGLVGVLLAMLYFAKKWKKSFLEISDVIVIPSSLGLMLGRIGNFVNGELYGKPTSGSWGVIFSQSHDSLPRYPSQLFESFKNLLILLALYLTFQRQPKRGVLSFLFLTLYGAGRILVEIFWRESLDGFILGIPKGGFYSIPILIIGVIGLINTYLNQNQK